MGLPHRARGEAALEELSLPSLDVFGCELRYEDAREALFDVLHDGAIPLMVVRSTDLDSSMRST